MKKVFILLACLSFLACESEVNINYQNPEKEPILESESEPETESEPEAEAQSENVNWLTHSGYYFDIKCPGNFSVQVKNGNDGALFTSPDKKVSFYVFSPLWAKSSEPELAKMQEGEKLVSEKVDENNCRRILWRTKTLANGDSFSFVDNLSDPLSLPPVNQKDCVKNPNYGGWVQKTFGIRYENQATYDKYRPLYMKFKNSLAQYAD